MDKKLKSLTWTISISNVNSWQIPWAEVGPLEASLTINHSFVEAIVTAMSSKMVSFLDTITKKYKRLNQIGLMPLVLYWITLHYGLVMNSPNQTDSIY